MPFTGDTFTHLFDFLNDPQNQEKIFNARLNAEFGGYDTGLSALAARVTVVEAGGGGGVLQEASLDESSKVTLTNNVAANCVSIALAAGTWDVDFMAQFACAASSCTNILAGLNTVSATLPSDVVGGLRSVLAVAMTDNTTPTLIGLTRRFVLASPATVYLVGRAGWGGAAVGLYGKMRAEPV